MYSYLLQMVATERLESMRAAAAAERLGRRARRQASPASRRDPAHLLRTIPHQREPEESPARRAA
jgi:hypothetical protein